MPSCSTEGSEGHNGYEVTMVRGGADGSALIYLPDNVYVEPTHMTRFNLFIPDRQLNTFYKLSQDTGLAVADLMRRMYDYCLREPVLCDIVPCMSGTATLKVG